VKTFIETLDATPSKRLYDSIIADYDLNKAITELIDNPLDVWTKTGKARYVKVEVILDVSQQSIIVKDNAGGIKKEELSYVIAPGHTSNDNESHTIGIFGVGCKRAVVHLAQDIKISTGERKQKTYIVEFDDSWLKNQDNWELAVYETDEALPGGTVIELIKLRSTITDEKVDQLRKHLQSTYARFIFNPKVTILLDGVALEPTTYENWAYPPSYEPRQYQGTLNTTSGSTVKVHVLAGLTLESTGQEGEYGMYFYCNDRLVVKALRTFEVGFSVGLAGKPHFNLSLARVIVSLTGEPKLMPWNSSKSGINTDHEVFIALRNWLVQVMKDYASLSRRFQGHWETEVFQYSEGKIVPVEIDDLPRANTSYLPPLPLSKPRFGQIVKEKNKSVISNRPWAKGAYEGIIAVDLITKQRLDQKNRIALILLDSNLEIAFKDYLVYESGGQYSDQRLLQIFAQRHLVQAEVKKTLALPAKIWNNIDYYYRQRCDLVHKRASVSVSDDDIKKFREVVELTLKKMFKLKFK